MLTDPLRDALSRALAQVNTLVLGKPREVRHPFGTMVQRIKLSGAAERIPKTFIYCSSPATGSFDQFAAKYRNAPNWKFFELPTGHDAMILMPDRVAEILVT